MPQTSVFLLVVAAVETVAKFILGVGSHPRHFFSFSFSQFHRVILERQHEQETHLVHDAFTLTELADYVLNCKTGGVFRQRLYEFAGMFDEHDAGAERGLGLAAGNKSSSASFVLQRLGQNARESALRRRISAARRP